MKITLIGAGNVAQKLGVQLHVAGEDIVEVFSRQEKKAKRLAKTLNAKPLHQLEHISKKTDLFIIAVTDDAIADMAAFLIESGFGNRLIVHTSGATPMAVLEKAGATRFGVFYPLQTFSENRQPDFKQIPMCLDANSVEDFVLLSKLAEKISNHIYQVSDEQRAALHVAAVFANNFTNQLCHISANILGKHGMKLDILLPLLRETVAKLETGSPAEMQTGPARRGDEETIALHLDFLEKFPEYIATYTVLTNGIKSQILK